MAKRTWWRLLSFVAVVSTGAPAEARDDCAAAVVSVAVGVVTITPMNGASFAAQPGTKLCPGDRVRIEPVSGDIARVAAQGSPQAAIWFPGAQKLIRVAPDTEVAVSLEP